MSGHSKPSTFRPRCLVDVWESARYRATGRMALVLRSLHYRVDFQKQLKVVRVIRTRLTRDRAELAELELVCLF